MRRVNLIPMAGEGQRFIDAGYTTPKPLIDINGLPMVVNAANSLPEADQWIFVCRESHIKSANIDKVLMQCFPGALILTVNQLTAGQVCTCLLARDYLRMDDQLTIGTCDNGMKYDYNKFDFFVGYLYEVDIFYVVPVSILKDQTVINVYPHREKSFRSKNNVDYEKFKNNFELLT